MPQKDYWENLKMIDHKYQFSTAKQSLSNFEP